MDRRQTRSRNKSLNCGSENELTEDEYQNTSFLTESSLNSSNGSDYSSNVNGSGDEGSFFNEQPKFRERNVAKVDKIDIKWKYTQESFDEGDSSASYSKKRNLKSKIPSENSYLTNPWILIVILAVLGVVFTYSFVFYRRALPDLEPIKNCPIILESNQLYPMEDPNFWKQIKVGIEHVQNDQPPEPAVFLLVYSDKLTVKKILNRILATVTLCLDSKGGALTLSSSELSSKAVVEDYGVLIDKYKPILERKRIMIVHDIQTVLASVAPVFHVFCDTSSPVVKRSAFFFTMEISEGEIPSKLNDLYYLVENKLENLWKTEVDKDKIQPLITRLTDNVLHVKIRS